jgi:hypothetical protein
MRLMSRRERSRLTVQLMLAERSWKSRGLRWLRS